MTSNVSLPAVPSFLQDFASFAEHLSHHFTDLGNNDRGDAFLNFATRLLPYSDWWHGWGEPVISKKKSHDKGVDFHADHNSDSLILCGQSKYRMREISDLADVFGKFQAYEHEYLTAGSDLTLFPDQNSKKPTLTFLVVTASSIENLMRLFSQSALPQKAYWEHLDSTQRIRIVDGPKLLMLLRSLYQKSFIIPTEVELKLDSGYLKSGNVFLSIISAPILKDLYDSHGSSLFFENIREFVGLAPASTAEKEIGVNDDIVKTLTDDPQRMLERNNGVTFKAEAVEEVDGNTLRLTNCGIVNGCQTTMCIVESGASSELAKVPVKIVESPDSWDVAKAANYQNSVSRIDLDLARFLRPQLVRKVATDAGFGVPDSKDQNVTRVLESIHRARVSYEGMRLLYLGLFSRKPNNLFDSNYNKLKGDVLERFFYADQSEYVMSVLFRLYKAMEDSAASARDVYGGEEYADLFKRFFRDENSKYGCFLAILAACGSVNEPLSDELPNSEREYERVLNLLKALDAVLLVHREFYERVFHLAFEIMAAKTLENLSDSEDSEIRQRMSREVSRANFLTLFRLLRMRMDGDHLIREYRNSKEIPHVEGAASSVKPKR